MRTCTECGTVLPDDYVMEIQFEDGPWETIPLMICPECFKKQMRKLAVRRDETMETAS